MSAKVVHDSFIHNSLRLEEQTYVSRTEKKLFYFHLMEYNSVVKNELIIDACSNNGKLNN